MLKKISAKKLLIGGCVLLAGALFLYIFYAVHKEEHAVLKILSEKVDLQIKDFHYTEVGDPDLIWEINADTARYIKKKEVTLFEKIEVKLFSSSGKMYTITGKNGSLHTDTKNMDIYGNVVAVSDKGGRFKTDSLNYTHGDGMIHTKDTVEMTRPGVCVKGVGMKLSLRNKKITILSDVRAVITKNGSSPLKKGFQGSRIRGFEDSSERLKNQKINLIGCL
ncbi:MAG: LPS export ABC transporter periplasmic protein LptC [Deltaproteobacteria bacterium]|nr:LPS export ABC transporter periplasmic protein LptC [Deltaproteobacteria bacterium]